ncbi:hypothetical protein TVAG_423360 [Trichomonas vaginalis G3]|uniref:F5/8 type C domain-containing protein n=1 Tax=Trichomonas vaginalis (strain ATCC PRA-98 / G3) TaxID=412133 RepID=A2DTH4_TRIV3|nr:hypothetical protein TVAGG3_0593560 [Trichomonas vaginalis G3]EAY16283.1 hypothetical protein TVAG_423360 [Trichomonas vaginalis G3]KAI5523433.1 hypothetical protein TVAGG3_0593560 [Trichomonas vaginalis G3]|eukprot:XP_001328506.1 hypothetical protein [Trichomonas vaginalis G3]
MFLFLCEELLTDQSSILKNAYKQNIIEYSASGSSSQNINGTIQKTKPEYAFNQIEKDYDWCSNCGHSRKEHPYLILHIKNRTMNLQGYYLKSGCSNKIECCCFEGVSYCAECCLYSWSFQISNDNLTWKTIHKVEKDKEMRRGKEKTYKFSETYNAIYVRLIQDEACPGDPPCLALNKIELIGTYDGSEILPDFFDNEDDDVSIIGHISKNMP